MSRGDLNSERKNSFKYECTFGDLEKVITKIYNHRLNRSKTDFILLNKYATQIVNKSNGQRKMSIDRSMINEKNSSKNTVGAEVGTSSSSSISSIPQENPRKNTYNFDDIMCPKCLELHLDQCEKCQDNDEMNRINRLNHMEKIKRSKLNSKINYNKYSYKTILMPLSAKITQTKTDLSNSVQYLSKRSNTSTFDDINKSIYALIFKEKSGSNLKENQIEDLIDSDYIDVSHLSTPFDGELLKNSINVDPVIQIDKRLSLLKNKSDFLAKRKKTLLLVDQLNLKSKTDLSASKVSKHYFTNLSDLQNKYRFENEKIKLSTLPAYTKSSNTLFNEIDKFDIAETYKKITNQTPANEVRELIRENSTLLAKVNRNIFSGGFISPKKIGSSDLNYTRKNKFEPPLMPDFNYKNTSVIRI